MIPRYPHKWNMTLGPTATYNAIILILADGYDTLSISYRGIPHLLRFIDDFSSIASACFV